MRSGVAIINPSMGGNGNEERKIAAQKGFWRGPGQNNRGQHEHNGWANRCEE